MLWFGITEGYLVMEINLLAWREYQYAEQQQNFNRWCIGTFIVLATLFIVVHVMLTHKITNMHLNMDRLAQQLQPWSHQIEQAKVLQSHYIEQKKLASFFHRIEQNQIATLHILAEMLHATSADIALTLLQQQDNHLLLKGEAKSAMALSQFVNTLRHSQQFRSIKMTQIGHAASSLGFQITAVQNSQPVMELVKK